MSSRNKVIFAAMLIKKCTKFELIEKDESDLVFNSIQSPPSAPKLWDIG